MRMRVEMNESEVRTVQNAGRKHSEQGHAGVRWGWIEEGVGGRWEEQRTGESKEGGRRERG